MGGESTAARYLGARMIAAIMGNDTSASSCLRERCERLGTADIQTSAKKPVEARANDMTAANTNCPTNLSAYEDARTNFARPETIMSAMDRAVMKPRNRWIDSVAAIGL